MTQGTEELRMIIDVASERGVMQERCAQLEKANHLLAEENAGLKNEGLNKDKVIDEQARLIDEQKTRIKELEAMVGCYTAGGNTGWSGAPFVVVNQYFLLDAPKTKKYVYHLDTEQKMAAQHLLMHTMPDNTPKQVYDQVNEMTQLGENPTERMADAMEKVAERPMTEYNIYPQSGSTANVGCDQKLSEFKSYQPAVDADGGLKMIENDDAKEA